MNGKRILVLPRYSPNGPSSRVRFYQYLPFLEKAGLSFEVHPFFDDSYITALFNQQSQSILEIISSYFRRIFISLKSGQYDLIWMQYELLPWLPYWAEKILITKRTPIIVDFDDAVFHRYDSHTNFGIRALLGKKIGKIMADAAVVVAGNPYLADYARQSGAKRVEILPSTVDISRYQLVKKQHGPELRIGWIGTPKTVKYLEPLRSVFERCLKNNIKLVIVGADIPGRLNGLPIESIPWSEEREVQIIQSLDIGIMPLPDHPFERGKCGYKIIQYMACSLPVVASPVGVNSRIVKHGANGFLAQTESEWIDALQYLIEHPAARKEMGAKGRKEMESSYTLQVAAPILVDIIHSLSDSQQRLK